MHFAYFSHRPTQYGLPRTQFSLLQHNGWVHEDNHHKSLTQSQIISWAPFRRHDGTNHSPQTYKTWTQLTYTTERCCPHVTRQSNNSFRNDAFCMFLPPTHARLDCLPSQGLDWLLGFFTFATQRMSSPRRPPPPRIPNPACCMYLMHSRAPRGHKTRGGTEQLTRSATHSLLMVPLNNWMSAMALPPISIHLRYTHSSYTK